MCFDDSIPVTVLSLDAILYLLWVARRSVYTTFSRLKLAAANLRRGPNPGLKLAAAYFSRKEIVRLYRRSRPILAAAYFRSYKWPYCMSPVLRSSKTTDECLVVIKSTS